MNKNFTIIAALGSLTVLGYTNIYFLFAAVFNLCIFAGVCRKIKQAFGKRGHGHNDNDANMGNATVMNTLCTVIFCCRISCRQYGQTIRTIL